MDKDLLKNLYDQSGEEIVVWESDTTIGLSIIKNYPENCGFIPVLLPNGTSDTKVLIRVGFFINQIKDNKVRLYISASKYSKYISAHLFYDFHSDNSPKKESIDKSNKSLQPIDLENNTNFEFDVVNKEIIDLEKNTKVTLNDIVYRFFNSHVESIKSRKGIIFKGKLKSQDVLCQAM